MVNKVRKQIIQNNKQIQSNRERYNSQDEQNERLQQIIRDYNKNKVRRTRICKDCHLVKCDYNGKDNDLCRFYRRFNSLYMKIVKKEKKKVMTASSEEGKKHLERLHKEERERKEVR